MKVLISSTYFEPYQSGLSVYALRLARGLVEAGNEVTVLTSQYDRALRETETLDGVTVVRVPVKMRVSKGVIMPGLAREARKWVRWADVVNLHLPQFESFVIIRLAKKLNKPLVVTYHCDLVAGESLFEKLAVWGTSLLGRLSLRRADLIVQNTLDYAQHSPVLRHYLDKTIEIPTPVNVAEVAEPELAAFRARFGIAKEDIVLGSAGRVAREKGYEYLARALPMVLAQYPNARVVHAGTWKGVVGEEAYQEKVKAIVSGLGGKWTSTGFLSDADFLAFFGVCDVLVFSSLNATESFGIVQIEALSQHTPIVASDLPGVRQVVWQTGMGKIVPVRDEKALAEGILSVLDDATLKKPWRQEEPQESGRNQALDAYLKQFSQENVVMRYIKEFESLMHD